MANVDESYHPKLKVDGMTVHKYNYTRSLNGMIIDPDGDWVCREDFQDLLNKYNILKEQTL